MSARSRFSTSHVTFSGATLCWLPALLAALASSGAFAGPTFPDPPPPGAYLVGDVGIFEESERADFRVRCQKLLDDKATPVVCVVIKSISFYGAAPSREWSVADYARALFLDWAIAGNGGEQAAAFAGKGVLVLISKNDRRVVIETGSHWYPRSGSLKTVTAVFAHYLERGDYVSALREGAQAIDSFVREKPIARPGGSTKAIIIACVTGVVLLSVISYVRQGTDGAAWKLWLTVSSALGTALTFVLRRTVNLGGRLASEGPDEADKGRLVIGRW